MTDLYTAMKEHYSKNQPKPSENPPQTALENAMRDAMAAKQEQEAVDADS